MIQYKPRKGLLGLVLGSSVLIGGGCLVGDIASEVLDERANIESNPLARGAIRGLGSGIRKGGQKRENTRVKYEDAKVDIYRLKEESKIRIEEERAMQNIYDGDNSEANETIRQVLEKNVTQKVINAVVREYKEHPFDWERNAEMIANAYELEDLTSGDRSKLQELLEISYNCTFNRGGRQIRKIFNKDELVNFERYWKVNSRRHMRDVEGMLKLDELVITHPDITSKFRCSAILLYHKRLKRKLAKLSNQDAIDLLRTKIELLEGVKDNVSLSPKESKYILSSLNRLEGMLRPKLTRTDPEFKEKEKEVLDAIKKAKTTPEEAGILTQSSTIELAKETGHYTQLKIVTDKIAPELKTQPKEPELTKAEIPTEIPNEESSSTGYWLIPLLAILGAGGGVSYKYRNPIYKKYKKYKRYIAE